MFHCQEGLFLTAQKTRTCGVDQLSTTDATRDTKTSSSWKNVFGYSIRFFWLILAVMLVVSTAGVTGLAWRNLSRVERVKHTIELTGEVRQLGITVQRQLLEHSRELVNPDPAVLEGISEEIAQTEALGRYLQPQTKDGLERLRHALKQGPEGMADNAVAALDLIKQATAAEGDARAHLLQEMHGETWRELELSLGVLLGLSGLAVLGFVTVRRRLLDPLEDLGQLISRLASGEFQAVPTDRINPILLPLFNNYNSLVARLEALEAQHKVQSRSLQKEVRAATEALLDQQRTLARAERLAAVGEMAAGLGHELRNPLAGILMSLGNLRRDISPDLVGRLDLAIAEIERLTRLLNYYLSTARHAPEQPTVVKLQTLVSDLLGLLRYQVPDHIRLECEIPEELECRLPKDRVRQAILNLVTNSIQALERQAGRIGISAGLEGGRLIISVCDDGCGFPPDLLRSGVQAFVTGRADGTGLGLAMVRRLAHELEGELELVNLEPHGACARLILPYSNG
jgi:two-component system NtrC family sensor kinase